jgi:nicotinamidase/pyrazinamidase
MAAQTIVIIDPQKDFTSSGGAYAKRHTGITQISAAKEKINRLLQLQKSSSIVIVQSGYEASQFKEGLAICIPGTRGHEADIPVDGSCMLFEKTQHSCFSSKRFVQYIKNIDTGTLVLCGFLAEYCVRQTALDALAAGYKVCLPEDCIGTGDDVQHRKQQMLDELKDKGAAIINSSIYF